MAKKNWFRIENKSTSEIPTIYIYGFIGESWYSDRSITCNQFVDQLNELSQSHDEINIRINSPGGSIFDGLAIVNAIAQSNATINCYNDGIAYSMAAIILLAGNKSIVSSASRTMIHTALNSAHGNSRDLRSAADDLDGYNSILIGVVAGKSGKSVEDVSSKWFNHDDNYLSPEQMMTEGLADEVLPVKSSQNYGKMTFADAYDYFYQLDQKSNSNNNYEHKNQSMNLPKFKSLVASVTTGENVTADTITAAQEELRNEGVGLVLITPKENQIRNQSIQALSEITALLPEGGDAVQGITDMQSALSDVTACFPNASEAGFNLLDAVKNAVRDAAAFAGADGADPKKIEQQEQPQNTKTSDILKKHYNETAASFGLPV